MARLIGLVGVALLFSGCATSSLLGILSHDFTCKGKATIVGGGSGFSGLNGTIDCGDGFEISGNTGLKRKVTVPE